MKLSKMLASLNKLHVLLFIVLLAGFVLRYVDLGYSDFYGDETKTFYLDKTVSAPKFFLDQRKGPIQFAVVWITEKIIGGHDEFLTRLPFALAGTFSIFALFLVVQKLFNDRVAFLATAFFSLNGFFIAFSRTIQYQSFLILFGLFSIYFSLLYVEEKSKTRVHYAVVSAIFLALAYLSHYDAVFFDIVIGFVLVKKLVEDKSKWREMLTYFLIPFLVVVGAFYLPYVINGFMSENAVNYVGRRLVGLEYATSSSWYTFWVYNPLRLWAALGIFLVPYLLHRAGWKRNMVLFWFLVPFIAFEFIFSNPGTHVHNYFIPLLVLISVGIDDLLKLLDKKISKQIVYAFLLYFFTAAFLVGSFTFLPQVNQGFPWKTAQVLFKEEAAINKKFHLFMYGFPYNRGWRQIRDYINEESGVRGVFTNDNDTIAKYYLNGISYTPPGPNFVPETYIEVYDNQEFLTTDYYFTPNQMKRYFVEKEFFVNGVKTATLYKYVSY